MNDKTLEIAKGYVELGKPIPANHGQTLITRIEALEIENAELYDREFTVNEERNKAATRIEALEAALRSVATTCREEIPLPYVGKMREVLLRNLAEWCEQALEGTDNG